MNQQNIRNANGGGIIAPTEVSCPRFDLGLLLRLCTTTEKSPANAGPKTAFEELTDSEQTFEAFERRLDLAASLGLRAVELTQAGNPAGAKLLLSDSVARQRFLEAIETRGLRIAALNCSGMPLHPRQAARYRDVIQTTIRLAGEIGVTRLVTMSGVGGDGAGASTVNWVFYPYPDTSVDLATRQWHEAAEYWSGVVDEARAHGVREIALELHPAQLVYNVPTLLRLREVVGPTLGATVDPSHLIWQQMDPAAVIRALGDAVFHVQLKDTIVDHEQLATAGVLDDRPFGGTRAWRQGTVGKGHGPDWWTDLLRALADIGFQGCAAIENEDGEQTYEDGVRDAVAFLQPLINEITSGELSHVAR